MADIKIRDVNKGSIKTIDRSIAASVRIRNAASEIGERSKDAVDNNESSVDEYGMGKMEQGAGQSVYMAKQAAEKASPYVAKGLANAVQSYRIRQARRKTDNYRLNREENQRQIPSRVKIKKSVQKQQTTVEAAQKTRKRMQQSAQKTAHAAKKTTKSMKLLAIRVTRTARAIAESAKALVTAIMAGGWVAIAIILCCVIFGAAFYFFGDESSQNYTPVSEEVEAYTPVIQKYADQYGIGEYTELIKAVMMQESGGKGKDPMQASECGYNKKYSRSPGGIKDPDYSVDCGVHYLASCLKSAKCENPLDMERIRLALQGYNYGSGYITWAIKRDGGYTIENAYKYSEQQAKKNGWSSYGDKQYPAHVLKYYPFGSYNYGIGNTKITKVASAQLGNKGGHKFWSWYGFSSRVPWCGCFVSWCANQCGYIKSGTIPKTASVPSYVSWFKSKGQWQKRSYKPSPGDLIVFDWDGGGADHIGIVESCNGKTITTIEGNSNNAVRRNHYSVGSSVIAGFCVPKY